MFKYVNNRLPSSFNNIWTLNNTSQEERELRNANSFIIPVHHFESLKKMPFFDLPKLGIILAKVKILVVSALSNFI
jgi:hypothetical protein